MRFLIAHNQYGAMSGEEHALRGIAGLLNENGHQVNWFLRSSAHINGLKEKTRAFFAGIHSPDSVNDLHFFLQEHPVDAAIVQNLYPFLSPSILRVLRSFHIPIIMRCPNYRLFCPNGLHLSRGEVCERCLGGREYWCIFRNCEQSLFKSTGYALRNTAARMTRRITDNVTTFIVLSEFQRNRFIESGINPNKLEILPNITPAAPESPIIEPGDLVSFVGRVSPEKGIEDFLAAAKMLPEISFAVAGSYDRMPDLPQKSTANVRWLGFLKGQKLDDLYQQSRMLVFPSKWYEGFPNVITRAMVSGKPVIASRLGAIPEIVEDGICGILFEPGNVTDMAEKIQWLYAFPAECRRMGKAGQQKAATQYSPSAVYHRLIEVIDRARQQ